VGEVRRMKVAIDRALSAKASPRRNVKLGAGGVEEIVELALTSDEHADLAKSAAAVREVVAVLARS